MRDFGVTAELPAQRQARRGGQRLRYVIQKHAATRLRRDYDFRLAELNGTFRSWAVTRGPSLDPAEKRLAVEVEDHPLDYGDFEGTIPKGQYGGGTVMLWDRGFWEPEGDPDRMLAKGDLKFSLDGEKLHGSWVLVRMRNDKYKSKRNNWLLIKHRDEYAKGGDGETILEKRSFRWPRAWRHGGDRKVGDAPPGPSPFMRAKAFKADADVEFEEPQGMDDDVPAPVKAKAKKILSGPGRSPKLARARRSRRDPTGPAFVRRADLAPLPKFVAPQLCRLGGAAAPSGAGWVHEVKFDGYRMQLRVEDGKAKLFTRKGLDWTGKFSAIAKAAAKLLRLHPGRRNLGALGSQRRAGLRGAAGRPVGRQDPNPLVFFAFDLLFADGEDLRGLPLSTRSRQAAGGIAAQGSQKRQSSALCRTFFPAAAMRC